jgi:hypothetical protein
MRKQKRVLIFSPITKKWEIARLEVNSVNGRKQWVRDDGSWICYEGDALGRADLPPKP